MKVETRTQTVSAATLVRVNGGFAKFVGFDRDGRKVVSVSFPADQLSALTAAEISPNEDTVGKVVKL